MGCQERFYQITNNEKHTIKNKNDKSRKELGATYCLGCKDFTQNFRPHKVKMTNKVLSFDLANEAFLKKKHSNKK